MVLQAVNFTGYRLIRRTLSDYLSFTDLSRTSGLSSPAMTPDSGIMERRYRKKVFTLRRLFPFPVYTLACCTRIFFVWKPRAKVSKFFTLESLSKVMTSDQSEQRNNLTSQSELRRQGRLLANLFSSLFESVRKHSCLYKVLFML